MKLPSLKAFSPDKNKQAFGVMIQVQAGSEAEAAEMQEAIQSFVSHFSVEEMKTAAKKLKSPANRSMIKTFL
ncbi:MAG: hypothetical protein BGO70_16550 [Bacteroidetes bacterium 43-93]|mgnify:FL=1|nr:hypothetical protein [Bacteroidota bacterium]OJX01373.1 MAG: hypothetical protein BGO70_16550 [Bacteroidetes bacterium 43-93]